MADGKFVAYYRVSTRRQGESGLGLEAQRTAVREYLNGGDWSLLAEFTEIESGKKNDRAELERALERTRLTGATLLIAKLDRLSRDASFLLNLRDAGVEFVAVDMPHANRLTVGIMALVAEQEREAISARTKAALAAAKARGVKLGGWRGGKPRDPSKARQRKQDKADQFAADLFPTISPLRDAGLSLRQIAASLTNDGYRTPRGGNWSASAVSNIIARIDKITS